MKPSYLQSGIRSLNARIAEKEAEYNQAMKDDREFQIVKKIRLEMKALRKELQSLTVKYMHQGFFQPLG